MAVPRTAMLSGWKLLGRASAQTASLSSFAARNATFLLALILIGSPVAGLRPIRAARWRTCRMPSPTRRRRLPFFRCLTMLPTRSLRIVSACFFAISWPSASSAARCLRVTVGWGFPGFLAAIVDRLLFERLGKRVERGASDAADRGQRFIRDSGPPCHGDPWVCRPNDQMRPGSIRKTHGAEPARPARSPRESLNFHVNTRAWPCPLRHHAKLPPDRRLRFPTEI